MENNSSLEATSAPLTLLNTNTTQILKKLQTAAENIRNEQLLKQQIQESVDAFTAYAKELALFLEKERLKRVRIKEAAGLMFDASNPNLLASLSLLIKGVSIEDKPSEAEVYEIILNALVAKYGEDRVCLSSVSNGSVGNINGIVLMQDPSMSFRVGDEPIPTVASMSSLRIHIPKIISTTCDLDVANILEIVKRFKREFDIDLPQVQVV